MLFLSSLSVSKRKEILFLLGCSILCFCMSVFRVYVTGSGKFLFLNWNLFLAFVPWATTLLVANHPTLSRQKRIVLPILAMWLLFFPNSPYIFTDLLHLRYSSSATAWYDMGLILCFAWTGLIYGFMSLFELEKLLANLMSKRWIPIVSTVLLFVTGFGVYLGRFLRWNSWDILSHPEGLAYDIIQRIVDPFSHPRTWGMTLLIGLFLNMIYWSLAVIRKRSH